MTRIFILPGLSLFICPLFIWLLLFFCPYSAYSAIIDYEIVNDECLISITGSIENGDAKNFEKFANKCAQKNIYEGSAILNAEGDNYKEGIALGNAIFKKGFGTLVKKDTICEGAAALAFLGGRFFGASGGWGIRRNLEYGATLAFKLFFYENDSKNLSELIISLLDYFLLIQVNTDFIPKIYRTEEKIFVNTPALLKELKIDVINAENKALNVLTTERARKAAAEILTKNQKDSWEFATKAEILKADDYKKEVLNLVLSQIKNSGNAAYPVINNIGKALDTNNINQINLLYAELNSLNIFPSPPNANSIIIKISGLNNIHYYMSKTAYFIIDNSATPNISVDYFFTGPADFSLSYFKGSFNKYGSFIYDLYEPNTQLWPNPPK